MSSIGDYNKIMSDHNIFNQVVYTPLSDALRLLDERQKDPELTKKIFDLLEGCVPEVMLKDKCAVMARQLATPNHENKLFIGIAKESGLKPIFFEYYDDKFTSNNAYKHSLGHIHIGSGVNKNGVDIVDKISIVDFNIYNGKKIKEVKTRWGESLVDFHKNLFSLYEMGDVFFYNENEWYKKPENEKPEDFYFKFFLLMACFGVLFENFLVSSDSEGDFTKNIILPAIERVIILTGIKPLIVPIPPMDVETDDFWYYHGFEVRDLINKK
jgi:hypothetical protein